MLPVRRAWQQVGTIELLLLLLFPHPPVPLIDDRNTGRTQPTKLAAKPAHQGSKSKSGTLSIVSAASQCYWHRDLTAIPSQAAIQILDRVHSDSRRDNGRLS
ncbi:hypothetical protein DPEC_G00208150 [Dallia pectoralis]|uniref:Uncharacterized protein n=1 Tax=Dallia pectoralis TaxID=75939 RepID=A0ACC2G4V3_DALPE|nr:hypothetical protein DPEC_G00208150 [Dallia pectoralis]